MNRLSNFLGSRGGQLFGSYLLVLVSCILIPFDHQTGAQLLALVVGAILRDMQDSHKPQT